MDHALKIMRGSDLHTQKVNYKDYPQSLVNKGVFRIDLTKATIRCNDVVWKLGWLQQCSLDDKQNGEVGIEQIVFFAK